MPRGKKRGAPFVQTSLLHGGSHLPFVGPIAANFGLMEPYWLKTNYKRDLPVESRDGAVKKHKIHNMDLQTARIEGDLLPEPLPEPLLVAPSSPSPSGPCWRGSSSSLYYEIVKVTCIILSLVLHKLESHQLPIMIVTIFMLPLWWIFCLWDDLRDTNIFLTFIYEYMYMLSCSSMIILIKLVC
jgi:hypothetical protein